MEFLGPQLFESRVTLAYEQDEAPYHVQELSRREMFSHMTEGSRAGTKKLLQMLPGLRSEEDSAADFRLMLHQRTKQLKAASETPLRYGWYLPNFTQKCFGCGKCEKACRSGALKLEDMPDGQTRVVVTPWKCSECGVCVAACSNSGIDGMKLRQLTTLGPVSVYKCSKTLAPTAASPSHRTAPRASARSAASSAAPSSVRRRPQPAPGSGSPSARPARQRKRPQRPLPQSWPLKMQPMLPVPPQPKRQRFPSLPHLPPRRQQLFLLQKQHLHPKRIDAAANQCYTQS